jgi:minor extracellular protease Epr
MGDTRRGCARSDVTAGARGRGRRVSAAVLIAATGIATAWGGPARAQIIDSTLEQLVEDQIQQQVTEDLADQLDDGVAQQVAADVAESVEQQVASEVVETVQQQVEAGIVETVQQQVEAGVVGSIVQQLESGVVGAIGQQLEDAIVDAVEGGLEGVDTIRDGESGDAVEGVLGGRGADDADDADDTRPPPSERFFAEIDPAGRAAERDVWVVLVPAQYAERIEGWGFTVRERHDLASIERVLLRVDAPEDRDIAQAALDLAVDAPGTLVDFNHVYRETADEAAAARAPGAAGAPATAAAPAAAGMPAPRRAPAATPTETDRARYDGLSIGIVDSAVAPAHEALSAADVVQRDFVPFAGVRPTAHGTAVASILVGDSRVVRGRLQRARLYAASVFFADSEGAPAATTASLVAALEWLVSRGVRVVNMSLAGPPNRVLEAAIGRLGEHGAVVVAAVGNNGPAGEPLYPAAYASVVGITAVDSANRIYRYANRGRQVMFAAPGVRIKVARSDGGYGNESGTSMAAPYAAAIIARRAHAREKESLGAVLAALQAAAIDLGPKAFDDVFGFGLIAGVD